MANWGSMREVKRTSIAKGSVVSNKDSMLTWLNGNIQTLEERGNLNPKFNSGVAEIRAYSMVSGEDRLLLLKCRNKKVYQSKQAAEEDKMACFDSNDYKGVLQQLKDLKKVFEGLPESSKVFNFWVRVKNKDDKSISVVQL